MDELTGIAPGSEENWEQSSIRGADGFAGAGMPWLGACCELCVPLEATAILAVGSLRFAWSGSQIFLALQRKNYFAVTWTHGCGDSLYSEERQKCKSSCHG